jgi:hypothetical protein
MILFLLAPAVRDRLNDHVCVLGLHSQEYPSIVTGTDRRLGVLGEAGRLEG